MIPLSIAPDLMEEAVLLAERRGAREGADVFRRERDAIYEVADPELREARFHALALRWFDRFDMRGALEAAVGEFPALGGRVAGGRIVRAISRAAAGADLVDAAREHAGSPPLLVLRLTPESLLDTEALRGFLRHELMHVADMLDPAFAYERALPASDDGPSADNLVRGRYRVLWDVTIDGRLARAGRGEPAARERRWREFHAAFAMLHEGGRDAFAEWWNEAQPTHRQLVAFAIEPAGPGSGRTAGRCPVCRFPVAALDSRVSTLAEPVLAALRAENPTWRVEQGLCPQCLDLYEARYGHATAPVG